MEKFGKAQGVGGPGQPMTTGREKSKTTEGLTTSTAKTTMATSIMETTTTTTTTSTTTTTTTIMIIIMILIVMIIIIMICLGRQYRRIQLKFVSKIVRRKRRLILD